MHEFSLVQGLLQQVEKLKQAHGMNRVLSIHARVGELAGIEPELFRSAYEHLAPTSAAGGAELLLTEDPLEARCRLCGHSFRVERFRFQCPACAGEDVEILRGEAVILQSVTFEKEEEVAAGPSSRAVDASSKEGTP